MCYPKPGPRCSAHARKQLVNARAENIRHPNFETTAALHEAEDLFFTTPAGFSELENRIQIGEQVKFNTEKLHHFKQLRSEQLEALRMVDQGDVAHMPKSPTEGDPAPFAPVPVFLPSLHETRKAWNCLTVDQKRNKEAELLSQSAEWSASLVEDEVNSVRWFTGNGFHEMGQLDRDELSEDYDESELEVQKQRIISMRTHLDSALAKVKPTDQIVYRGVSEHSLPEVLQEKLPGGDYYNPAKPRYSSPEAYENAKADYYDNLAGQTVTFPRPTSTSADPGVGLKFAHIDNEVIYEIKAKHGVIVTSMSIWGTSEQEVILPAQSLYKVVGVNRKALFSSHGSTHQVALVQLEEI